jgi:hypothetical protein
MFADVASRRITAAPGVLIKRNVSFLSKFLYSSVRFLLSVDDSPIALGDQSRVLGGRLARKRVSLFRVNRLFEMICVKSLSSSDYKVHLE